MCNQECPCKLTRGFHPCAFLKISNLDFDRRNIGGKIKCYNFLFHRVISDNIYGLYGCNIITLIILLSICLCTATSQTLPMIDNNLNNPFYQYLGYNPTQQVQPYASLAPEITNLQPEAISSIPSANFQSQNVPQIPPVDSHGDSSQLQLQTSLLSSLSNTQDIKDSLMRGLPPPNIPQPTGMQQTGYSSGIPVSSAIPQVNSVSPSSGSNAITQLIKTLAEISSKEQIPQTSHQLVQPAPYVSPLIAPNDAARLHELIQTNNKLVKKDLEDLKSGVAILLLQLSPATITTGQPPVQAIPPQAAIPDLNTKEGCKHMFPNSAVCELLKPSSSTTPTSQEQLYLGRQYYPSSAATGISMGASYQGLKTNQFPQPSVTQIPTTALHPQQSVMQPSPTPYMTQPSLPITNQPYFPSLTSQPLPTPASLPSPPKSIIPPPKILAKTPSKVPKPTVPVKKSITRPKAATKTVVKGTSKAGLSSHATTLRSTAVKRSSAIAKRPTAIKRSSPIARKPPSAQSLSWA